MCLGKTSQRKKKRHALSSLRGWNLICVTALSCGTRGISQMTPGWEKTITGWLLHPTLCACVSIDLVICRGVISQLFICETKSAVQAHCQRHRVVSSGHTKSFLRFETHRHFDMQNLDITRVIFGLTDSMWASVDYPWTRVIHIYRCICYIFIAVYAKQLSTSADCFINYYGSRLYIYIYMAIGHLVVSEDTFHNQLSVAPDQPPVEIL